MSVLGVDACKAGWVGVRLGDDLLPSAFCGRTIDDLVRLAGAVDVVAIDIPIGLPDGEARKADSLARLAIGPRRSSVFSTPARSALVATTHAEATAISVALTGMGLSQQAYALGPKILEVDEWVRRTSTQVVEVHPEVSFATLAGRPLTEPKKTWAGFMLRRRLLSDAGIHLADDLGLVGVAVDADDVLDAAVAAWSALRVAKGEHISLPHPAETMPDGYAAAIVA